MNDASATRLLRQICDAKTPQERIALCQEAKVWLKREQARMLQTTGRPQSLPTEAYCMIADLGRLPRITTKEICERLFKRFGITIKVSTVNYHLRGSKTMRRACLARETGGLK